MHYNYTGITGTSSATQSEENVPLRLYTLQNHSAGSFDQVDFRASRQVLYHYSAVGNSLLKAQAFFFVCKIIIILPNVLFHTHNCYGTSDPFILMLLYHALQLNSNVCASENTNYVHAYMQL